jgi:Zn-dependent protease
MFGTRWQLFRILGVPINVDASWLLILALLTWNLVNIFDKEVPDLPDTARWLLGLATALGFFTCLVLHELGHALAARSVGVPIRGITLFLFGGVAEMGDEPPSAAGEFFVAVAGPVVSAVLAGLLWLSRFLVAIPAVTVPLGYLAFINLVVLLFNLVPAFPLDGGRVLRSALWAALGDLRRATYWASLSGKGFAFGLIGLGLLLLLSGQVFHGLWLCLIGMFLYRAAQGSYEQVLVRQVLSGEPVARFMHRAPIVVPPELDLRGFVEDYVYRHHRKMFPVAADGRLPG